MRPLLFLLCLWASAAAADLCRWIDPEAGSAKYSSVAPSWYGDGERQGRAPAVAALEARWRDFRGWRQAAEAMALEKLKK
jgi:hypothetical protein